MLGLCKSVLIAHCLGHSLHFTIVLFYESIANLRMFRAGQEVQFIFSAVWAHSVYLLLVRFIQVCLSLSLSLTLSGLQIAGLMFYSSSGQVDEGLNKSDASISQIQSRTHPSKSHGTQTHTLRALAVLVIITFSLLPC